jgi:hypothetical protein
MNNIDSIFTYLFNLLTTAMYIYMKKSTRLCFICNIKRKETSFAFIHSSESFLTLISVNAIKVMNNSDIRIPKKNNYFY